jgi:hypothetical protein
MPHDLNPISVGPGPSQNRTYGFSASSSSGKFTDQLHKSTSLIADSVPLTMLSQVLGPALSPLLDTPARQPLPSPGITRLHRCCGLIRLPVPHPRTSFPRLQVPPFKGRNKSPQVPEKSLEQHAVDYDPGGVSAISPLAIASLLPSGFLIPWACSTT